MALRDRLRKLPLVPRVYCAVRDRVVAARLRGRSPESVFTEFYENNRWRLRRSVSGRGSDAEETRVVRPALERLVRDLEIHSLLDIPCGDFLWMRDVDLHDARYIGADIVEPLVSRNRSAYARDGVAFRKLNLLEDELPRVDLVLCRDCLVHFSNADLDRAVRNIVRSGSTYLLTTTFPNVASNRDIATGQWRAINLERAPLSFPRPLRLILEECPQPRYEDKSLGLWRIDDLRALAAGGAAGY